MTQLKVHRGDITKVKVNIIVNAANSSLLGGGGVDGAIHRKGGKAILEACRAIRAKQGKCKTGEAVITTAGLLPAQHVIHTVGPVWNGGSKNEKRLLYNAYYNSLKLASEQNDIQSIAFPNISTGIYRFPKALASEIALKAAQDFIQEYSAFQEIIFVCYDEENYMLYQQLLDAELS